MVASAFDSSAELILKVVGKMQKEDFEPLHCLCVLSGNHCEQDISNRYAINNTVVWHIGWQHKDFFKKSLMSAKDSIIWSMVEKYELRQIVYTKIEFNPMNLVFEVFITMMKMLLSFQISQIWQAFCFKYHLSFW